MVLSNLDSVGNDTVAVLEKTLARKFYKLFIEKEANFHDSVITIKSNYTNMACKGTL